MPSLLSPPILTSLRQTNVSGHSVDVKSELWRHRFCAAGIPALHQTIFGSDPVIRLSRDRLLNHKYATPEQKTAEVLLWGYPRNHHGVVSGILPELSAVATAAASGEDWADYVKGFPKGVGSSTITKLAYFHHRTFNGMEALILDNVIADQHSRWTPIRAIPGLGRGKGGTPKYLEYLQVMQAAAGQVGVHPAQLELFLFKDGTKY